jgi:hypothetical protein
MPRRKIWAAALVVPTTAACFSVSACSLQPTTSGPSPATDGPTAFATKHLSVVSVTAKACIDATASSDRQFAGGVRRDLEIALSGWVPPLPTGVPTTAEAGVPGLTLWVRQVLTDSYSTQSPSLDLQISAVPALPAPPSLTDPNLATDQLSWASREQVWRSGIEQALRQEAAAVAALKSYLLDHNVGNWSAISGCAAALAGEGSQNPSTRMLLASDLQENRPPVPANYAGAAMLIDENCPSTAQSCTRRGASWTARFRRQGMGRVAIVRADAATQEIDNWLLGGRS